MMKQKILILTDYRNQFYESVRSRGASFNVEFIRKNFEEKGYGLTVKQFHEVDFLSTDHNGTIVIYQSAEDRDLLYKDYIEDILLGLMMQGANLIPDFIKFRAHHNKVFMEILRNISNFQIGKQVFSKGYGTFEEFAYEIVNQPEKLVMKPASGARSTGVKLLKGHDAQLRYARRLSISLNLIDYFKIVANSFLNNDYRKKSWHRRKFIVQEFIPDLDGDYKVLVYGEKFYVLQRKARKNDFRASGSGNFTFPITLPPGMLDYAFNVFSNFKVPFISMDIAKSGDDYVLIEFQFLSFGNYTLEHSSFYFTKSDKDGWTKNEEVPNLEREFVESIVQYIDKHYPNS